MNKKQIQKLGIAGEIFDEKERLIPYSHDASLFEVMPEVVVAPKNVNDIEKLVQFVAESKKSDPMVSITARSAGTDMSGGPLNQSIILDFTKHFNHIGQIHKGSVNEPAMATEISATDDVSFAVTEPGVYYRDFEKETLKYNVILPTYPASRELCTVGGMAANDSAGEKTLTYGKTENYVMELDVVLSDGNEYTIKPLNRKELEAKMAQDDFEGTLYKKMYRLITDNYDLISHAKPAVSKNSAGYYLWNVWDKEKDIFDLNKLIVGSQGTLGIITKIKYRLVEVKTQSKMLVVFMRDLAPLADLANDILKYKPESFESYDDKTLQLAMRFFPEMVQIMKPKNILGLAFRFLPELHMLISGGFPKLVLMAEFTGNDIAEIDARINAALADTKKYGLPARIADREDSEKYWTIRRESFNLLRKHIHGKRTAPFIDDIVIRPEFLPEFLPKLNQILSEYDLIYTIAGHVGNGNFHIIPLMDLKDPKSKEIIKKLSAEVYNLVLSYHGSTTAEHNDGLIRSPYLLQMYGPQICVLFKETKEIFDPLNIFNPGKKVGASLEYAMEHLVKES